MKRHFIKRPISAASNQSNGPDIFKMDTDTSYYNNFLNEKDLAYMQKSKNRTGEVVYMTPVQYYEECVKHIFEDTTVESLKLQRSSNSEYINKYKEDMLAGDKFPLCYLNYADHGQEGLHRMMAAGEAFGWNIKFPVLVVRAVDNRVEELNSIWRYWNDAVYHAKDVTYNADTWEQEFIEEVEYNLECRTEEHYEVIIVGRRDKEECEKHGTDYAIEIALADFVDIMHPVTVFEPKLKNKSNNTSSGDNFEINDDDLDITEDDLDWDLITI